VFVNYFLHLESNCNSCNPFHNHIRAAGAAWAAAEIMHSTKFKDWLSPLELVCVLLSCLARCANHPGFFGPSELWLRCPKLQRHIDRPVRGLFCCCR
jgi:hypothetical protein